MKTEFGLI